MTAGLTLLLAMMAIAPIAAADSRVASSRTMAQLTIGLHADTASLAPTPRVRRAGAPDEANARPVAVVAVGAPAAWRMLDLPPPTGA